MRNTEEKKAGAPEWMVTYSDVISLLVTFFVMLLTFSTADREKFDKARGSLEGAFGIGLKNISRLSVSGMIEERYMHHGRSTPTGVDFPAETLRLERTVMEINDRLKNEKFGAAITIELLNRGVMFRIPADAVFIPGTAVFAAQGEQYLAKLAAAVGVVPHAIEITSHVSGAQRAVSDPWRITHRRSARVAQLLHRQCGLAARRLTVSGMGDSHPLGYKPSPADDRIEITLVRNENRPGEREK